VKLGPRLKTDSRKDAKTQREEAKRRRDLDSCFSWRLGVLSEAGVKLGPRLKTDSRKDAKTQRQRRKGKRAAR